MKGATWAIIAIVVIAAAVAAIALGRNNDKNKTNTTTNPPPASQTSNNTSNQGANSSGTDQSTSQSPTSADKVSIESFAFSPAHITVKKGTTVTWTNNDSVAHTVSGDTADGPKSGNLAKGETYTFTFNSVGTFGYHCNLHQSMHGTVTVTE
jgi:plastocyanin